eukprot:scaffold5024_cov136-Cylindrotheca_fusiformis.AAC.20
MRTLVRLSHLILSVAVLSSEAIISDATAVAAPPSVATAKPENGNPAIQLLGYLKDSIVRTIDGTKEMWSNHGRCKEIRGKQKDYRDQIKKQWEFEGKDLTPQEMKKKLQSMNGGITYDEFVFLSKGKEDRGRLMNLIFLMWGAPKVFPYALMFYPDILPTPFQPLPDASGRETKLEKLSRQRSHIVIQTLLRLEKEAKEVPGLSKLNIFGKKRQLRKMDEIHGMGTAIGTVMNTPGATNGIGANQTLGALEDFLYKKEPLVRQEKRLVGVPKAIILGLANAVNGPAPLTGVQPNFLRRGAVLTHIQKIADSDNFLVSENIDLGTLSTARLLEACSDRMIGGPQRSDEELRQGLSDWLNLAVIQPSNRTAVSGEHFNENLARTALLSYYSMDGARDARSSSFLPRLMFQGQSATGKTDETTSNRRLRLWKG